MGKEPEFKLHLDLGYPKQKVYFASTFEGILAQLKADGHQIWGTDVLDYSIPPKDAMEHDLMTRMLKERGLSHTEIAEIFSLDYASKKKAHS